MSNEKMGGPAFPVNTGNIHNPGACYADPGMALWDYYAAAALDGLMAAQIHGFTDQPSNGPFAEIAARMADAMLAERTKRMEKDDE